MQFVIPKTTTGNFYYQVRAARAGGFSDWVPAVNGVLGRASAVSVTLSASVSPGTATASGGAASLVTGSVTVTPAGGTSPYTYAWTWASGGASITIDANTSQTTTFSATALAAGETRTGQARCTVTDNVSATFTVDVEVTITRVAPTVTAPAIGLSVSKLSPGDASVAFRFDSDGNWYSGNTLSTPTTNRGPWVSAPEYANDYKIRITRTSGTETVFTSGTMGSYVNISTDPTWRLTNAANFDSEIDIFFTIEIARISDSVVVSSRTNNGCSAEVFTNN
jgi:hypothetical protein